MGAMLKQGDLEEEIRKVQARSGGSQYQGGGSSEKWLNSGTTENNHHWALTEYERKRGAKMTWKFVA